MNISISEDLQDRMRPLSDVINWSSVAQKAFENEVAARTKGRGNMQATIERLRASKARLEEQERPRWTAEGAAWASDDADFDQLAQVGEIDAQAYEDLDHASSLLLKELCRAVYNDPDPDAHQLNELTEQLTGDRRTPISYAQLTWYIEGAQQVWEEVKDQV